MYFFIEDYDLIEKYYITWDKASADIKKKFDSKNLHDKFFWKPKLNLMVMKLHIFTMKNIPKADSNHT